MKDVFGFMADLVTAETRQQQRQMQRAAKREDKARNHQYAGLNGKRAVARRQWQIERGQLRVSA